MKLKRLSKMLFAASVICWVTGEMMLWIGKPVDWEIKDGN